MSQVRCNRLPEKVCKAELSSTGRRFRRREKFAEKVPGRFGAEPGQVQQGSGEGSGEGLGGFGAESGQIPEKVWELWCRARSGSTGFGKRFRRRFQDSRKHWCKAKSSSMVSGEGYGEGREALVQSQSQVRFNRVSEKVPSQVQQASGEGVGGLVRFNREKVPEKGEVCGEGSRTLWRRARSGSTGIRRRFRRRSGRLWCRVRADSREGLGALV